MQAPKDIVLLLFIVQKSILNVMFGLLIFEMSNYYDFARILQLLRIIISNSLLQVPHLVLLFQQVFGSFRQTSFSHANRLHRVGS